MEAVAGNLDDWGCGGRVIGMVYDTTASNTGAGKGSTVLLQQEYFVRPIFYIECRHLSENCSVNGPGRPS